MKQTKATNGRRMIVLFSKKYGKISAGTGITEKGKGKSALAMRPFTFGRYELYKSRYLKSVVSSIEEVNAKPPSLTRFSFSRFICFNLFSFSN
ncbi:MAG: recombination protein O N-terminal domain-containing protein, partial [Eubacteriales bacterium]|nr:recombination protein O N-terminal domain-containing protein [Eubacteriales bacterium]